MKKLLFLAIIIINCIQNSFAMEELTFYNYHSITNRAQLELQIKADQEYNSKIIKERERHINLQLPFPELPERHVQRVKVIKNEEDRNYMSPALRGGLTTASIMVGTTVLLFTGPIGWGASLVGVFGFNCFIGTKEQDNYEFVDIRK